MVALRTEIDIAASAARVWDVLTDFAAYPEWNPFIRRIEGILAPRCRLLVRIQPPGGRAMTFRPTVLRVEPERELAWRGRTLVPGLFDGEHHFRLEPRGGDSVRFVHGENFSGALVPLLRRTLETTTRQGFEAMNAALKTRAESTRG
jgi:hypothetical protein